MAKYFSFQQSNISIRLRTVTLSNSSIWSIDWILSGSTTPSKRAPGSDSNVVVLSIPRIFKAWPTPSDGLTMFWAQLPFVISKGNTIVHDNICRTIGFTLLSFKMAVMPLVPETKTADLGKLISLGNLLVRKVSAHNYVRNFDFVPTTWQGLPIYTLVFQELIHLHFGFPPLSVSPLSNTTPYPLDGCVYILQPFFFLFWLFG